MHSFAREPNREPPEQLVARLRAKLRGHAAWDLALVWGPPLLAVLYIAVFLYRRAWISQIGLIVVASTALAAAAIAAMARYRVVMPTLDSSARLLDEKAGANDRFVTLATIEVASSPETLVARLRDEARKLAAHVEFRRDFGYKLKRSFHRSVIGSLLAVVLFHLFLPLAQSRTPVLPPYATILDIAEEMARRLELSDLGARMRALAAKLQDPRLTSPERQTLLEEIRKEIAERQQQEGQQQNRQLLGEAASAVQGLEQESGGGQPKQQQSNGGSAQSEQPQERGEGSSSQGNGGDSKGDVSAEQNSEMREGMSARADLQQPGRQNSQRNQGQGKPEQPDKQPSGREEGKETAGKIPGDSEGKGGQNRSEEIPQGAPPSERFVKPGEGGKGGLKGAGYVTVQLPEELAADGNVPKSMKEGKEATARPKVPISNIPLPAHVPDAPREKQHVPLEYRGMIR